MMCMQKRYGYRAIYNHDSRAARDFAPAHLIKTKKKNRGNKKIERIIWPKSCQSCSDVSVIFVYFIHAVFSVAADKLSQNDKASVEVLASFFRPSDEFQFVNDHNKFNVRMCDPDFWVLFFYDYLDYLFLFFFLFFWRQNRFVALIGWVKDSIHWVTNRPRISSEPNPLSFGPVCVGQTMEKYYKENKEEKTIQDPQHLAQIKFCSNTAHEPVI